MPSASPSARTDCPSTASRRDGQQTRHESGPPCRLPQETHDTPSTTARRTRRPYAVNPPAQIEQPSQLENTRTSEEGEEHEGKKGEKMRTCARLPAVLPSKSYIDRTPPPNGQPSAAPGQQAPQPAPAEAPSLPTYSRPFLSLLILLLESLQNPGPFSPVSRRTTTPRPPAWTPPAPGEPSHFRARPVSHETAQYLYSITYTPYPHFSLGNNLDDSPIVNELNPYL